MNIPPTISVILPSYNHGKFIGKTIVSILNQTFTNFELIISDDGSTDNTMEVIRSFKDERIRIHRFNKNVGSRFNFMYCIDKAKGKYIAMAHSDDYWHKSKLEKQIEALKSNPEVAAVFTLAQTLNDQEETIEQENPFKNISGTQSQMLQYLFYNLNCLCHPSVVIEREIYRSIIKQTVDAPVYSQLPDFYGWIWLLKRKPIYVIPEELVYFRIHDDKSNQSASTLTNNYRYRNELYFILSEYFDDMPLDLFTEGFKYDFINKDCMTKQELECEKAFIYFRSEIKNELKPICLQIGLDKLYKLVKNKKMLRLLEKYYKFNYISFYKYMGSIYNFTEIYDQTFHKLLADIQINNSKKIAIYGSGELTINIVGFFLYKEIFNKLTCVIERDEKMHGNDLLGLSITSLDNAISFHGIDTIIIGSEPYQEIIYERIRNVETHNVRIVKLFTGVKEFFER